MASLTFDVNSLKRSKSVSSGQEASVSFKANKRLCLAPSWTRRNSATVAACYTSSDENDDDSDCEAGYMNNQRRARQRATSMRRLSVGLRDNMLNTAVSQYSDVDNEEEEEKTQEERVKTIVPDQENWRAHRESLAGLSSGSKSKIKRSVDCDKVARNRCFEYLVGAIDEAWARYCDATSYAEDEVYNGEICYQPATPASIGTSDVEDDDDDDGYKSASTNITDYDSDFEVKRVSGQPGSVKLQHLKDRLLKAKYYLQDYLESNDLDEATAFWKRWDLIKYATIELVEDDDDDDVIESTIEDLERGRLIGSY
jgi:hypothetical protein